MLKWIKEWLIDDDEIEERVGKFLRHDTFEKNLMRDKIQNSFAELEIRVFELEAAAFKVPLSKKLQTKIKPQKKEKINVTQ